MPSNRHNSGQATIGPGGSQKILDYCAQRYNVDQIPPSLQLALSARPVSPIIEPGTDVQRDIKADIIWRGERGGGQVEVDVSRGTCLTVPGSNIQVIVRNLSDPVPGDVVLPADFQDYFVECCVGLASSEGRGILPTNTQIAVVDAADAECAPVNIPAYARELHVYGDFSPLPVNGVVSFWSTSFPIGAPDLGSLVYQASLNDRLIIPSGAEFVQVGTLGAIDRILRLVFEIGL